MSADPLLVLQMQRMGDLILAFPLIEQLRRRWPGHPVWVAAEPQFFKDLIPLSPQVVFFPPSHCAQLAGGSYALAVNLSSRPEAAQCLARLKAPVKLGPAALEDGLSVHGFWNLYRAALTQNNRHNVFHWADLYLLDVMEDGSIAPGHSLPKGAGGRRVGLMLGASEAVKHPKADFWTRLARRLVQASFHPVFLGGAAEAALGEEVAARAGLPRANFCGRLSLAELAGMLRTLALFITPDTGPMHLADWLGVPVLNLSMGPVHARETGPRAPGQWILRAALSCVGCWQCGRGRLRCHELFSARAVANVALELIRNPRAPDIPSLLPSLSGLALFKTGRDALGLYRLEDCKADASCRLLLEDFWRAAFLCLADGKRKQAAQTSLLALREAFPAVHRRLGGGLARLAAACSDRFRQTGELPADFWRAEMPLLRLFTGWLHMFLQNSRYSREGWRAAVEHLTVLGGLF